MSGYTKTFVDYPTFDVRLLKRCLQKTAWLVFGTLDPFRMTKFMIMCLKGAENQGWMQSRQSLRMAIETADLSHPGLLDVVCNIIGVWPLIVSDLKRDREEGQRRYSCGKASSFSFLSHLIANM